MALNDTEAEIETLIHPASFHAKILESRRGDEIYVLKYTSTKYLASTITAGKLLASNMPGYTWGDAVYVAPIASPRATMMYGGVGIVGTIDVRRFRFFDATDTKAIDLYQQWIGYLRPLFTQLTTTVHANHANQQLRNLFRGRFQIDCVIFPPDEPCAHYVDTNDVWLALTHWNPARQVAHGATAIVQNLRWCVIGTDTFDLDGLGYRAVIHPKLSAGRTFTRSGYSTLAAELVKAYNARTEVIITEF